MADNYILLERIELNASAASVTFSNIPQSGYTDLKIVASARTNVSSVVDGTRVRFNNDTTSGNYTARRLYGDGTSTYSDTNNLGNLFSDGNNATANTFSNCELYIPNYLSSNAKSYSSDNVAETNATTQYMGIGAQLWSGTSAINTITISPETGTAFLQYSTFSLYGLAAVGTTPVIAPKASGGSIYNDGTYWYHAFRTTDAFVPQTSLTVDVVIVAGGGGGGQGWYAGGGGAGGLRAFTNNALTATSYTVTVGAGGAGNTSGSKLNGANGSTSTFNSLSVSGGGGGAGYNLTGSNGGSGGGGGGSGSSGGSVANYGTGNTGSYSPIEGNRGGNSWWTGSAGGGGGGGGAGAVGSNASNNQGAAGGAGASIYNSIDFSTWLTTVSAGVGGKLAGGGGGGSIGGSVTSGAAGGGSGGGSGAAVGTAAVANTGSGGGGGGDNTSNGGNGGSGIVIIRYPIA